MLRSPGTRFPAGRIHCAGRIESSAVLILLLSVIGCELLFQFPFEKRVAKINLKTAFTEKS